ncbi:MAG: prepilin peptidase [Pirellulales bacterium]|nr:prepilin peptidase [Pirellulales bacterium]
MNWIPTIPIEARLAVLFALGGVLGSLANLATYRLAWHKRSISPLSPPDPGAPPRVWFDRVPIFGWLGLWRESAVHGRGFWIRPMLVELLAAFGLAWLYYWEVVEVGLLPPEQRRNVPAAWQMMLHAQFVVHAILFWLMLAASLIDLDEKTIPDEITVPGALVGLALAVMLPGAALPDWRRLTPLIADGEWSTMTLGSPVAPPDGYPAAWPLALGLACWALWCFGLLRRDWYARHGLGRAVRLCLARLARTPSTPWIGVMAGMGAALIVLVWTLGGPRWTALLSALVGMAAAAGIVWTVRLVGGAAMGREAMGFGDVTLMAMIGAYVGWQASVFIFFLSPLVAVVVGVARYVVCRDKEIPFGPFLCLATVFVVLRWDAVWNWASAMFRPAWLVPASLGVCAVLLGVFLTVWQMIKRILFRPR